MCASWTGASDVAFIRFEDADGGPVLVNVERVVWVAQAGAVNPGFACSQVVVDGSYLYVRGTFDEVMARIADAVDVYVDGPAPLEAEE